MAEQIPEFLRVLEAFNAKGVKWMVVGGYAVNFYGYSRTTGDIDLYIKDSTENRRHLVDALESLGYGRFDALLTLPILAGFCEIMMDDGIYADLMTQIPGIDPGEFDIDLEKCEKTKISGVEVRYISYKQLIENKKATGRPKDTQDIQALEEIRNTRGNG